MFAILTKDKKNIEVELNMSEMDLTAAESKVTDEVIKNYMLEYAGLKVSRLCIAQEKKNVILLKFTVVSNQNRETPRRFQYV